MAKTLSAIGLGLIGGFAVMLFKGSAIFADPLRPVEKTGCGCGPSPFNDTPVWAFWREKDRLATFGDAAWSNLVFLTKWLSLAYLFEVLMIRYVPAEAIATVVGGDGLTPILIAATVGAPAYLNGYAAVPLLAGLIEQGMNQGAAMACVIAGGVSSIPAAVAGWALVKPRIFAVYIALGFVGALSAGIAWSVVAAA